MRGVVASGLVCLSVCDAFGAASDYLRTETANYNGYDGATLVTWTKTSSPKGRAWAVKFDLTKGFRMRACYGDGSGSRATVVENEPAVFGWRGLAKAEWFDSAASDGSSFRNVEFVSRGEMTEILALGMDAGFAVRMR